MIRTNKGYVQLNGTTHEVMSDLATIIHAVKEALLSAGASDKEMRELIADAGRVAFMTDAERADELKNLLKGVTN